MAVIFRDARNVVISEHRMRLGVFNQVVEDIGELEPFVRRRFKVGVLLTLHIVNVDHQPTIANNFQRSSLTKQGILDSRLRDKSTEHRRPKKCLFSPNLSMQPLAEWKPDEQIIVAWLHQRWVWHTTALKAVSHVMFYEDLEVGGSFFHAWCGALRNALFYTKSAQYNRRLTVRCWPSYPPDTGVSLTGCYPVALL